MADGISFNNSPGVGRPLTRTVPAPANPESRAAQTPAGTNAAFNRDALVRTGAPSAPTGDAAGAVLEAELGLANAYAKALELSGGEA